MRQNNQLSYIGKYVRLTGVFSSVGLHVRRDWATIFSLLELRGRAAFARQLDLGKRWQHRAAPTHEGAGDWHLPAG